MLRISKLTDYGTIILVQLANHGRLCPASDVANDTGIALPTVQKLLKALSRSGLVESVRGVDGGYQLSKAPADISAADILDALEGPIAITECSSDDSACEHQSNCSTGGTWQQINVAIRNALLDVTLADMHNPKKEFPLVYTVRNVSSSRESGTPDGTKNTIKPAPKQPQQQ
jgi:FeS assembly SUF system regulator